MTGIVLDDTVLVTVNKRLAAELRDRHDVEQARAGNSVWPSPDILPWDAWLNRLYEQLVDDGRLSEDLLGAQQEQLLWQQVVEQDSRAAALLHTSSAARSAQRSSALYTDWQLDTHPLEQLGGEETLTFLRWQRQVDERLRQQRQLTRSGLLPRLVAAIRRGDLRLPRRLHLAGFDALSPAQQALFDTASEAGCEVATQAVTGQPAACRRVVAPDPQAEVRMAAAWADAQTRDAPERRIAVVVPQLERRKADIVRLFGQVLAPAAYVDPGKRRMRFNVSLGDPLASLPLAETALLLLDSLRDERPLAELGRLLRSPFVGGHGNEQFRRARLDAALREDGMPRLTLRRLHARLADGREDDPCHCPLLLTHLDAARAVLDALPARDTPAAWARHLHQLLAALGWPGDGTLDSVEFQQFERFKRLLGELAALAKVVARMTFADAIQQLRALAQDTLFQAESGRAPIQVLGPLEAGGLHFDAIWLLGMHDQVWPAAPQPDPLLPAGLQRELGMPHASAEREHDFAAALTDQLRHACDEIVASHAQADGDVELRPSPLIADWPVLAETSPAGNPALSRCYATPATREVMPAPAAAPPAAYVGGGSGLLAAQAACPFRAVALHRMAAQPLAEATTAVDPALAGNIVHELLQRLWQQLGDSTRLACHDRQQIEDMALGLAEATLRDVGRRRPDLFTPRYVNLEARRLARLVADWLDVERRRDRAFRVVQLEQRGTVSLGELELKTRADRVDELADGTQVIIDYKTGRQVVADGWFDERLSEPQLPLYCVADAAQVGAALLGRVRNDDKGCRFVGLSRVDGVAPGVMLADGESVPDWDATVARWRSSLHALAAEIMAGRADPTPSPQACEYCPLDALCRVANDTAEGNDE